MSRRQSIIFDRGALTDWLISELTTALGGKLLLGDGIAPEAGGWPNGEPAPGAVFIPYAVLNTSPAGPDPGTPIGSSEADSWRANYDLPSFGAQRQQADWAADLMRVTWDGLSAQDLALGDGRHWKVGSFQVSTMGAVRRNDQLSPPLWQADTSVALTLSRRHGD